MKGDDNMSFSSNVKDELCQLKLETPKTQMYELEALMRLSSEITITSSGVGVIFQTANPLIAKRLLSLLKNYIKCEVDIASKKVNKLNQNNQYIINIKSMSDAIIDEFGLLTNSKNHDDVMEDDLYISAYLRGAFLAKGSVNSPESSNYHLEIYTTSADESIFIQGLINHFDLDSKITRRRDSYVIYMKSIEAIKDFLRIIGAQDQAFVIEESQIERDITTSVQRKINIEVANDAKAMNAAQEQIKYIRYLEYNYPLEKLDGKILLLMKVRKQNPEATLNELIEILAERYDETITKSGINHRFRKIKEIALKHEEQKKLKQ